MSILDCDHERKTGFLQGTFKIRDLQEDRRPTLCRPTTAPLPQFPVEESPTFIITEIDFAGPLLRNLVRRSILIRRRSHYIALYACGSSRAVHIDVVPDLSAETFIRTFRRFVFRRGIQRLVVLDNVKTEFSSEPQSKVEVKFGASPMVGCFIRRHDSLC